MELSNRYRANTPSVVADVIDGEAIIIHLQAGTYFSMTGSALTIWEMIAQGASVQQIIDGMVARYEGNPLNISFATAPFLTQLLEQDLIAPVNGETPEAALPAAALQAADGQKQPFETPRLEIYRDMQNLLMIDPIHDVGEAGWPQQQ